MSKRYQRPVTRVIEGGRPRHKERTFDPYPIRCEVEPCQTANVGTEAAPTNTTAEEPNAPSAMSAPNSDHDEYDGWPDGYGNPY